MKVDLKFELEAYEETLSLKIDYLEILKQVNVFIAARQIPY